MVEFELVQLVFGFVTTASVVFGIAMGLMQLRDMKRTRETELETRQAQLLMQLYSIYDTRDFLEDYGKVSYTMEYSNLADWNKKYGPINNLQDYASWARVGRFFDGVGILVRKGLIDPSLVTELMREVIIYNWERVRPWVNEQRSIGSNPHVWENYEYLYGEIRKRTPGAVPLQRIMTELKETSREEE